MSKLFYPMVLILTLGGCATETSPIPEGYSGPIAIIKDSIKVYDSRKTDYFSLEAIDERNIPNSRLSTRIANKGKGFRMAPVLMERKVPVQIATFKIVARTEYAAPILALSNTVYQVIGKVSFTPEVGKAYVVKGELGENYSGVWIEEESSHKVVVNKTEVNGSAALGFFEK